MKGTGIYFFQIKLVQLITSIQLLNNIITTIDVITKINRKI